MITERDLEQAIAECQGERNPNANTCIKLAAFYTIKHELYGNPEPLEALPSYSYASGPTIEYTSDSDFASIINGKDPSDVWPVMDELMSTLQTIMPRLYDGVMRRLQD